MVAPLGSEGSRISVLKSFMVYPGIRICGLSLSKYQSFEFLGNESWFNIVNIVVAAPMLPVLGCLVVYF